MPGTTLLVLDLLLASPPGRVVRLSMISRLGQVPGYLPHSFFALIV